MGTLFAPINSVTRVTTYCYDPDTLQVGENVGYFRLRSITGAADSFNWLTGVSAASVIFSNVYLPQMESDVNYSGIGAAVVSIAGVPVADPLTLYSAAGSGPGTFGGAITGAGQLSGLASFRSSAPGRSGRARKYFPFVPGNAYDADNLITDLLRDAYVLTAAAWFEMALSQAGTDFAFVGCTFKREDSTTSDFISASVTHRIATQRRRGAFGKTNALPIGLGG